MRLLALVTAALLILAVPFVVFGEVSPEAMRRMVEKGGAGPACAGVGLLVLDVVLPIPSTFVMTCLGAAYGPLGGAGLSFLGSMLAAAAAYGGCRAAGRPAARRMVGERDLERFEAFFSRYGGAAVILSRPLPLVPEAMACLAGLGRMPAGRFFLAAAIGSLPVSIFYSALGRIAGPDEPFPFVLLVSLLLPGLFWIALAAWFGKVGMKG